MTAALTILLVTGAVFAIFATFALIGDAMYRADQRRDRERLRARRAYLDNLPPQRWTT